MKAEFKQVAWIGLAELLSHKFRSFLTVLGVTIGVMAVIAIAAIIHGLNTSVMDRVAALGSKGFFATKHDIGARMGHQSAAERQRKDLTYDERRRAAPATAPRPAGFALPDRAIRCSATGTSSSTGTSGRRIPSSGAWRATSPTPWAP